MNWAHFYEEGGWGMFPTTFFGVLLLLAAGVYAMRPEERFHRLLFVLGVLAVASGTLGFVTGVITTFHYVAREAPEAELYKITVQGLAESAHNLLLAGIAIMLSGITAGVGALKVALGKTKKAPNGGQAARETA